MQEVKTELVQYIDRLDDYNLRLLLSLVKKLVEAH